MTSTADAPPNDVTTQSEEAVGAAAYSKHLRVAQMFADEFRGKFLHVHGVGWHRWDGKRFRPCIQQQYQAMQRLIRKSAHRALTDTELRRDLNSVQSYAGQTDALKLAATMDGMGYEIDEMDADPYLINLRNGTYCLRTRVLRRHTPEDRITKLMGGSYDPANPQRSALWEEFLLRVLPDREVRDFLQRFVGMAMLGEVREHNMLILLGGGRNGKGVFYGRIAAAFHDYAAVVHEDLILSTRSTPHPTATMDLVGCRWAYISELSDGRRMATANMKRLTGGDRLKGRHMYKDFTDFDPSHSLVLVTNTLPHIAASDAAAWERIRVVPFDVFIPPEERDTQLWKKLDQELDAVIAWMVVGWDDYERQGLAEPDAVKMATDEVREDFDCVKEFIEATYDRAPGSVLVVNTASYAAWSTWAAINSHRNPPTLRRKDFYEEMRRHGVPQVKGAGNKTFMSGITPKAGYL